MIVASGNCLRNRYHHLQAVHFGQLQSISVVSGRCCRNRWTASRPFEACRTKFISGWVSRTMASPSGDIRWSSTVRMGIKFGLMFVALSSSFS